ncbi:MAG: GDSL-type esterase/lipase family protein [Alistipes sp.]
MKQILLISILSLLCLSLQAQDSVYCRANEWRSQIDEYYRKDSIAFPQKGSILFVGSSSIRMWHNLQSYFPNHRVLARGFGGARMSDVLYHMQRLILDYKPSQIVLYAGENDLANGVEATDLVDDIKCFVRIVELQLPGVPIIILSVKPSPYSAKIVKRQRDANRLLYAYSQTKPWVTFLDISTLMFDAQGNYREELYRKDRLHITDEAYKLWQGIVEPHLINNLN